MSQSEEPAAFTAGKAGLIIAMLGLAITLSGALLSWFSSYQSTNQAREAACIARLDARELRIREKADDLLGAIGAFTGHSLSPYFEESTFHEYGSKLIESSFRFMAYAPGDLNLSAAHLLLTMHQGLTAKTQQQRDQAVALASTAMRDWPKRYISAMNEFENLRAACE